MRVINTDHETITEYDLTKGVLVPVMSIKEDAEPIDNKKKFAWRPEDYEQVQMYVENQAEPAGEKSVDERLEEVETMVRNLAKAERAKEANL